VAAHLVVVPHTHWDREWYRTHEEFRYRLVRLLDGLLDLLEATPAFSHFTLDGQTIVLDDYLEVRPQARPRLERLVRSGRLLVGPWYVLPDEWLVSGEALIRNLRLGLGSAAAFGGSMRVGYVPDQFGHVGQLPQILAGFGLEGACLWRGVGREVDRTLFTWEAPDGTALLTVHLIQGYGNAAQLPLEPVALAERLRAIAGELAPRSPIPSLLLMNGSDHLEPQPGLPAALAAASPLLEDADVEIGTLPGFFERARKEVADVQASLPRHRGELRSGSRAPLLPGCASSRIAQKRADFRNDRLLTRYLEPLCTWLAALGADPDPGIIDLAWRTALENHPHDSICGCSVDAVHEQMDTRFARVAEIAGAHLRRVSAELGAQVRVPKAGFGRGAGAGLVAWNPHGSGAVGVEGALELDVPPGRTPRLHLRDADGRRLPARVEREDAGATFADYRLPAAVVAVLLGGFPEAFMGLVPCGVRVLRGGAGLAVDLLLGSEALAHFDFATARRQACAFLADAGDTPVRYRARRLPRLRLGFVDALPGYGLRVYRVAKGSAGTRTQLRAERTTHGAAMIENAAWRVEVAPDARVRCLHRPSGAILEDAIRLVSEGDRGDEYNFDPVPGALRVERPERVRVGLERGSEAEVGLRIDARYRVPVALTPDRADRARRRVGLSARLRLRLWEGLDRLDLALEVDNSARDHRLRLHLRAPFRAERFEVESAFEVVERPIDPPPDAFGASPAELPVGATPQRGFASLRAGARAFTVANRGSAEVEAVAEADDTTSLAVTVLRAVGWLSRDDLALRPGHAGPPLETPGAQVPGPQRCELSLRLHAADDPARSSEAHRFSVPALAFPGEGPGPLEDGARLLELDDPQVRISAFEPRGRGAGLVRLYNASPQPRSPRLRWHEGGHLEAVDLAERPDPGLPLERQSDGAVRLALRAWQIATLRWRSSK
jgi:alpha-mannosidase